ncbi:uncharacterized protein PRCAT00002033001 [Priceomyces carsonii]|uniref:uncharacterized protein n=1 Tax=Priceomyces carsonii TaxID=28549 RepID=UPI002ED9B08D|nr:unnamed protein product [Priceomyces carsonii]
MPEDFSIDTFLHDSVKKGRISGAFLRSQEFIDILDSWEVNKTKGYEQLFYSRNEQLKVNLTREGARLYNLSRDIFNEEEEVLDGVNIDLTTGYKDYKFYSRSRFPEEAVRGTKYVALLEYEKVNGPVRTNIITSRHTLLDLMMIIFKKEFFCTNLVHYGGQIYMESNRKSLPIDKSSMTGYNFEAVVTVQNEDDTKKPFVFVPLKSNAIKYNSMILHEFPSLDTSILVSCEIDAIKQEFDKSQEMTLETDSRTEVLENYIELKSKIGISNSSIIKAILQCYVAGTSDLKVGIRDKHSSCLKRVAEIDVKEYIHSKGSFKLRYLDKWLAFICSFIKLSVRRRCKGGSKREFRVVFDLRNDMLKIFPYSLNKDDLEITVLPKYLAWRAQELESRNLKDSFGAKKHCKKADLVKDNKEYKRKKGKKKRQELQKGKDDISNIDGISNDLKSIHF